MLYDCWQEVVRERGAATAVVELATGRRWSFRALAEAAAAAPEPAEAGLYPQGHEVGFLLSVLQGWRYRRVVCPLEPEQSAPKVPEPPREIAHLKLTSATTGPARCVAFREEQLVADVTQIRSTMGLRPEWPNLGAISLAHSYGFSNLVLPLLLQGIPLILCPSALPEAIRRARNMAGPSTLPGVPALWRAWLEADALGDDIRLAISAGAPLPLPLEQAIYSRYGLKVHNFYGASECGGIAYDRTQVPRTDGQLAGTPMDEVRVAVDAAGCLEVRSASVGATYWPEPDPRLGAGVYRTQDLAACGEDGVRLLGRAGDLIHVAGRKVPPEAVERVLREHPGVVECLVLGLPDEDDIRQETVGVVVVAKPDTDERALREFLRSRLPAWQIPRRWQFVASLETNARGKFSRAAWRSQWCAGAR